tara:strand:+ start:19726 stop:21360 length:1635 start_codon:yes stop_codon:yes gene_type:complete
MATTYRPMPGAAHGATHVAVPGPGWIYCSGDIKAEVEQGRLYYSKIQREVEKLAYQLHEATEKLEQANTQIQTQKDELVKRDAYLENARGFIISIQTKLCVAESALEQQKKEQEVQQEFFQKRTENFQQAVDKQQQKMRVLKQKLSAQEQETKSLEEKCLEMDVLQQRLIELEEQIECDNQTKEELKTQIVEQQKKLHVNNVELLSLQKQCAFKTKQGTKLKRQLRKERQKKIGEKKQLSKEKIVEQHKILLERLVVQKILLRKLVHRFGVGSDANKSRILYNIAFKWLEKGRRRQIKEIETAVEYETKRLLTLQECYKTRLKIKLNIKKKKLAKKDTSGLEKEELQLMFMQHHHEVTLYKPEMLRKPLIYFVRSPQMQSTFPPYKSGTEGAGCLYLMETGVYATTFPNDTHGIPNAILCTLTYMRRVLVPGMDEIEFLEGVEAEVEAQEGPIFDRLCAGCNLEFKLAPNAPPTSSQIMADYNYVLWCRDEGNNPICPPILHGSYQNQKCWFLEFDQKVLVDMLSNWFDKDEFAKYVEELRSSV